MPHSRRTYAHPTRSIRKRYHRDNPIRTKSDAKRSEADLEIEIKQMQDGRESNALSVDRRVSLTTLDEDVALQIFSDLNVEDVISLRKTSKDLTILSRFRTVWHNALISNVLSQNLPIPSLPSPFPAFKSLPDLQSLSSEELEILTRESLAVRDNWTSPAPTRTFCARLRTKVMRLLSVTFLPSPSPLGPDTASSSSTSAHAADYSQGRPNSEWLSGRYFVTFGYIAEGLYSLQIWDAEAVLDSSSTSSSTDRICRNDEEDPDNIKLVGEWLGSGRATGLAVCNNVTADEGTLNGFCSCYQDRQSSAQRSTLRIFSFNPHRQDIHDSGVYSREDSLRALRSVTLARPVTLVALTDSRVILQLKGIDVADEFLLLVRDWRTGWTTNNDWEAVLRPSKHGMGKTILSIRVIHDFIVVFRESVVDIYFLPSDFNLPGDATDLSEEVPSYVSVDGSPSSSPRYAPSPSKVHRILLRPSASHKWTWSLNSLAVTERYSWYHERRQASCRLCEGTTKFASGRSCQCVYRPLSLAVRFDSYFPWPVNLIHHFVVHTSPEFDPSALNPLDFAIPINGAPHSNEEIAPCSPFVLPPQNTYTIPSSVRLFGRTALVLGSHGTLVWLDSESDYVPLPLLHQGSADRMAHASAAHNTDEGDEQIETEGYAFAAGTGERIASIQIPLTIPLSGDSQTTNTNSGKEPLVPTSERVLPSLIAARSMEGWTAVATDERAGRIVVGDSEGFVEVWDYY
ncbi:hypothetical protein SCHPADRAFT_928708 [Schizopora paradoxa]|uniref:F-box domain-containing protein n=1 Tax=Schizopora paradoxa TaxID=27342 RepID=A0A0H2S8M1_9AGAM|nr:hypothetical protein SCHPADRAFT_928708 [Schizopora paradoxa]